VTQIIEAGNVHPELVAGVTIFNVVIVKISLIVILFTHPSPPTPSRKPLPAEGLLQSCLS
jgi:hypothetical protein